jgi:hypothetical protein
MHDIIFRCDPLGDLGNTESIALSIGILGIMLVGFTVTAYLVLKFVAVKA